MLDSSVLHQSQHGSRGESDVVGISWKAATKSHPSPSLVVTCAHQVVVYKPGESRRTHQWSFKPSAATVLSHAAVFLPAGSRYVGVQQGSTLVSWRESEKDVKRPLSSQAAGAVQAVHACPQLGDYFVVVLASGAVAFYQGELQPIAQYDAAGSGDGAAPKARAKTVWSGVRGNKLLMLETNGVTERVVTFILCVPSSSSSRRAPDSRGGGGEGSAGAVTASVTLVSSHVLAKPSLPTGLASAGRGAVAGAVDEEAARAFSSLRKTAEACSATLLGGRGGDGPSVLSVGWRTPRGPVWTKFVVGAGGAREEFSRPAAAAAAVAGGGAVVANGAAAADDGNGSLANGHKNVKAKLTKSIEGNHSVVPGEAGGAERNSVPAIAAADGGRLFVHSGGASPRLLTWDATYGVLLEDSEAPELTHGGAGSVRTGRAARMLVSGDGAHLALTVASRVVICPLPVKRAGTLASLLRRERPALTLADVAGGPAFPSVDLARSAPALSLLERTGALKAGEWESVVMPFREAEADVIRSLRDAACRRDGASFEGILREHAQRLARGSTNGDASEGILTEEGGKKRRRNAEERRDYSAAVVAAAVELCLANPEADLWCALALLVRSGAVSARHHRDLVATVVEHGSPELLEEVMLHVPDLPEADAVQILRYFLSQAAISAKTAKDLPVALASEGPQKGSRPPLAKRARGEGANTRASVKEPVAIASASDPTSGGQGIAAVKSLKKNGDMNTVGKKKSLRSSSVGEDSDMVVIAAKGLSPHIGTNGNSAVLSNGHIGVVQPHDDEGTSIDSGGVSDGDPMEAEMGVGGVGGGTQGSKKTKKRARDDAKSAVTPAARAERGVRVALTLPHNEAFLRSALSGLSHGEVIVVLKVFTRLLSEGRTRENASRSAKPRGKNAAAARGLPLVRTDSVLGWASAVLDSHFTRLAMGGAADANLVGCLKALKKSVGGEAECCELLCQVRSLVDEIGRRHAAAATEEARRRPKRELFTLRVLRF